MEYLWLWIFLYWIISTYAMWIMVKDGDLVTAFLCIFTGWAYVPARLLAKIVR